MTGVKLLPAPPGDGWPPLPLLASLCTTIRWGECRAGLCVIPTYNNKNTPRSQYVQQNKTKGNHVQCGCNEGISSVDKHFQCSTFDVSALQAHRDKALKRSGNIVKTIRPVQLA